ncbi:hypothetical protein [uncultured Algoriphagus sp.]|uniref:hypothetical protein n=1 Tax=uncultured Algoriphagus sp. TaxID=417365 RepID=UPI00259666F2|nr:hypothetical protein [uncultured Algoriphagus sp.]
MERLNDEDLDPEQVAAEVKKAKASSEVGGVLGESAKVEIQMIRATGAQELSEFLEDGQPGRKGLALDDRPIIRQIND